jgi:hypothetical protein
MGLRFDLHVHTQRYSQCSRIDEDLLIPRAIEAGLDGLVITEHHCQWTDEELQELRNAANAPSFQLYGGFEYTSNGGDMLVYGLPADAAARFEPGRDPDWALGLVHELGGVCVAAHPTRAGVSFDERILQLRFDAIEVQSVNLQPHEQRLAKRLAQSLDTPLFAASDAHRLEALGAYALEFEVPIASMADLCRALRQGRRQIVARAIPNE